LGILTLDDAQRLLDQDRWSRCPARTVNAGLNAVIIRPGPGFASRLDTAFSFPISAFVVWMKRHKRLVTIRSETIPGKSQAVQ